LADICEFFVYIRSFFDLTFVIVERCHDAIFMQFNLNTNLTVEFSYAVY